MISLANQAKNLSDLLKMYILDVFRLKQPLDGDDPLIHAPSILDIMGYREDFIEASGVSEGRVSGLNSSGNRNPPAPPTTCFSPLASSSSPSIPGRMGHSDRLNDSSLEPSFFSPYSTALSVTIAIGKILVS
jgi:hypothetical protein